MERPDRVWKARVGWSGSSGRMGGMVEERAVAAAEGVDGEEEEEEEVVVVVVVVGEVDGEGEVEGSVDVLILEELQVTVEPTVESVDAEHSHAELFSRGDASFARLAISASKSARRSGGAASRFRARRAQRAKATWRRWAASTAAGEEEERREG